MTALRDALISVCSVLAVLAALAFLFWLEAAPPGHRFGSLVETPANPLGM